MQSEGFVKFIAKSTPTLCTEPRPPVERPHTSQALESCGIFEQVFFSIADVTEYWSLLMMIIILPFLEERRSAVVLYPTTCREPVVIVYVSECYLYRLREADVVGLREAH